MKSSSQLLLIMISAAGTLVPAASMAQQGPSKGSGELVVTTGGGTWEAAQRKAYFDPFEKATGIKIVLVPEDHAKLLASVEQGTPEADLTSINAGELAGFQKHGAVQKIDYKYFDKDTLDDMPDALKNAYGVGAVVYSVVMAYNTQEYPSSKPRPQSWAEFFDTKTFPGPRGMARCEKIVDGGDLEFAALASGVDKDKLYPIDMDRAFKKLEEIKPSVARWWQSGADAPQSLVDGEISVSTAYNGRVYTARKQGAPLDFTWNQSLLQYDYWVVMKGSPNYDNAMKFLAFISKAEPQAVFAQEITYGPVNKKSYDLIKSDISDWLPGSPKNVSQQIYQNYAWWNELNADGKSNWEDAISRCAKLLSQ